MLDVVGSFHFKSIAIVIGYVLPVTLCRVLRRRTPQKQHFYEMHLQNENVKLDQGWAIYGPVCLLRSPRLRFSICQLRKGARVHCMV